jgi:hypothetical protein
MQTKYALIFQIYFVKKFYVFQAIPLPIVRSFPLHIQHWYTSYRCDYSFRARPGWNSSGVTSTWEISASVAFIKVKFVTTHCHMNVKFLKYICYIYIRTVLLHRKLWHPRSVHTVRNNTDEVRPYTIFITANPRAATSFGCVKRP